MVMNTPGGNTVSTAQLAMSLLCALARNIPAADMSIKSVRLLYTLYSLLYCVIVRAVQVPILSRYNFLMCYLLLLLLLCCCGGCWLGTG